MSGNGRAYPKDLVSNFHRRQHLRFGSQCLSDGIRNTHASVNLFLKQIWVLRFDFLKVDTSKDAQAQSALSDPFNPLVKLIKLYLYVGALLG
ncbi:MAG TPA: hypothetical protein VN937_14985 [Blastocatellia bacterium]|nr:hypothetical protein [Blastocatellia bacterium]